MKILIKKIIAVILSLAIFVIPVILNLEDTIVIKTNAAEVPSENIGADATSFSYTDPLIYVADCISKKEGTSSGEKPQAYTALWYDYTYQLMAEALMEKEFTVGFSAIWNNINNLMNGDFKEIADGEKVFYEIVLMDYMIYTSNTDDFENNCYDVYNNCANKIYVSLVSEYSSSGVDNALNNMSKMDAVEFAEKYGFLKEIGVYADFVGGVLDGASTVKEYYDNLARAMAICEVSEGRINFLRQIREIGENAGDKDLVEAADEIIELYEGSCAEFVFNKNISASLEAVLSCIWDAIVSENPILKTVKIGTLCINAITNGEEVSENNLKLLVLYIVNSYTEKALRNDRDAYLENSTNENARKFLNTYTCYLEYQKYATECAKGFTSAMLLEGAWNALKKENKDTYETFCGYFADDISFCEDMNRYISVYNDEFYENVGYNYSFGNSEYTEMYKWPEDGEVVLLDKDVKVDSVRFKVEEYNLLLNYTVNIPTRTFPKNAGSGIEYKGYYSTNTNIIKIDAKTGKITPVSPGIAYACVETVKGIVGKCKITVLPFEAEKINGKYKITNYEGNSSHVTIPSSIEGTPVTGIGISAFSSCDSLTSITIPDSVTSIGELVFSGCDSLTSIKVDADNKYYDSRDNCNAVIETSTNTLIAGCQNTVIPNSVTSIGDHAFYYCTSLTSITIPDSVTSIGLGAFFGCSGLTGIIEVPKSVKSIRSGAFFSTNPTKLIVPFIGRTRGEYVDMNNPDKLSYIITNSSTNLKEVEITDETVIPSYAFDGFDQITKIKLNEGITKIASNAFFMQKQITELNIPTTVTEIGDYAFYYCCGLTGTLVIPEKITSIGNSAFACCSELTGDITIPESVTSISDSAFYYCSGLTSVSFPNTLTSIGNFAFWGCSGLTGELTIPEGVVSIGYCAFDSCYELTSITIPNSVTSIGHSAFSSCWSLTGEITIPEGVTSIEESTFNSCWGLTSISLPDSLTSIEDFAFSSCWSLTGEIAIPDGVTSIGSSAFLGCSGLTGDITIPEGVTSVGDSAFFGCSGLSEITIPKTLKKIGNSMFEGCYMLTQITIPNSVTSIGDSAFSDCMYLSQVYYFGDDFNSISIGTNNSPLLNANITYLKLGDTDCDKIICINDATLIQLYLANFESFNDENLMCADVNDDGVISVSDVTMIQMYIAKIIESF